MKYSVSKDITFICKLLNISYSELANYLGVARSTVNRIVKEEVYPNDLFIESFYSFAYENDINSISINELKIKLAQEQYGNILFHGARGSIEGDIDLKHSRSDIDVGCGFYLGESFEQASSYVFANLKSSVYLFDTTQLSKLKIKQFDESLDWMLMVSYYRGQLEDYKDSKYLKDLINEVEMFDVIIAPIADNNMYETMNMFARGDITDLQAVSALSMSHLGLQHVLKTEAACKSITMVDRLYLCKKERQDIEDVRRDNASKAYQHSREMIEKYRRQGKYIEEILK